MQIEMGRTVAIMQNIAETSATMVRLKLAQLTSGSVRPVIEQIKDQQLRRSVVLALEESRLQGRHEALEFAVHGTPMPPTEHGQLKTGSSAPVERTAI